MSDFLTEYSTEVQNVPVFLWLGSFSGVVAYRGSDMQKKDFETFIFLKESVLFLGPGL